MWIVKGILQLIGLAVVVWIITVAIEEYIKIRQRKEEESRHG